MTDPLPNLIEPAGSRRIAAWYFALSCLLCTIAFLIALVPILMLRGLALIICGVSVYFFLGAGLLGWQAVAVAWVKRRARAQEGAADPAFAEIEFLRSAAEAHYGFRLEDGLVGSPALVAEKKRDGAVRRLVVDLAAFARLSGPLRRSILEACAQRDDADPPARVYRAQAAAVFDWLIDRKEPSAESLCRAIRRELAAGEAMVFCGAGISIPSGLPGAAELTSYLLKRLGATPEEVDAIGRASLPFEVVMEALQTYSDMAPLLKIFSGGVPNRNHRALARLVRAGRLDLIATTNFDRLIEAALESEGLELGSDYRKIYRESDLAAGDWPRRVPLLLKLHGSIDAPEEMAITLRRVAQAAASRRRAIRRCFGRASHRSVVVLGYSASDVFDLSPEIEAVRLWRRRVYFVEHFPLAGVERITVRTAKNPFRKYRRSFRLFFPTDRLIADLWRDLPGSRPADLQAAAPSWRDHVDAWWAMLETGSSAGAPEMIVGSLLEHSSQLGAARARLHRGLEKARSAADLRLELKALIAIARTHSVDGQDPDEAKRLARSALDLSRRLDDRSGEVQTLRLLNLHLGFGNAQEIAARLPGVEEVLAIARSAGDSRELSGALFDLGLVRFTRGEIAEAAVVGQRALDQARQAGAKDLEAQCLGLLGVCAVRRGHRKQAADLYAAAISLCSHLGSQAAESFWLRVRGDLAASWFEHPEKERPLRFEQEALEYYQRALEKAREFGGRKEAAEALLAKARTLSRISSFPEAESALGEALHLALEAGDPLWEAHCRAELAKLFVYWSFMRGSVFTSLALSHEEAVDHALRARSLAAAGGHLEVELSALTQLGELESGEAGTQAHLEALAIAERLDRPGEVAHVCFSLADRYAQVPLLEQALPYYRRALGLFEEQGRDLLRSGEWKGPAKGAMRRLRRLIHRWWKLPLPVLKNRVEIALVQGKLGVALVELGRHAEAIALLKKAEEFLARYVPSSHEAHQPHYTGFRRALFEAEWELKRAKRASSDS